jgi:ATP-dependent RNA helicase DDX24/MAK5
MAPEQKKRQRPVPTSSQRSKKRQKIMRTTQSATTGPKNVIALDAMPWNEVEMPEMFEDAEGFFGLEEVDDIEVIRDGNKIQFVFYPLWKS